MLDERSGMRSPEFSLPFSLCFLSREFGGCVQTGNSVRTIDIFIFILYWRSHLSIFPSVRLSGRIGCHALASAPSFD